MLQATFSTTFHFLICFRNKLTKFTRVVPGSSCTCGMFLFFILTILLLMLQCKFGTNDHSKTPSDILYAKMSSCNFCEPVFISLSPKTRERAKYLCLIVISQHFGGRGVGVWGSKVNTLPVREMNWCCRQEVHASNILICYVRVVTISYKVAIVLYDMTDITVFAGACHKNLGNRCDLDTDKDKLITRSCILVVMQQILKTSTSATFLPICFWSKSVESIQEIALEK